MKLGQTVECPECGNRGVVVLLAREGRGARTATISHEMPDFYSVPNDPLGRSSTIYRSLTTRECKVTLP